MKHRVQKLATLLGRESGFCGVPFPGIQASRRKCLEGALRL
jgi:hypothetical protein